jgi:hypothetical protein
MFFLSFLPSRLIFFGFHAFCHEHNILCQKGVANTLYSIAKGIVNTFLFIFKENFKKEKHGFCAFRSALLFLLLATDGSKKERKRGRCASRAQRPRISE